MSLVSNIVTTLFARVAISVFALVSSIILARMLGPEGRGLFALILLMPELAKTFGLLGFEQANAVYAGVEPDGRQALVWQSVTLAAVVGGIVTIVTLSYIAVGAPGLPSLTRGPIWLYVIALSVVPAALATEYWGAIIRGMNQIFLLNMVDVGSKLISLVLLIVFLVWLRLGVAGAVLADAVLNLAALVIMGILLNSVGAWGRPSIDRTLWKRTAAFALPAYFGTVMLYLNYRADLFIIAILLTPEELGFYALAVGLAERIWVVMSSVGNALLPHLTNLPNRNPNISAIVARHVLVWTGLACIIMFLAADVIVRILYSSLFASAVAPLRWLLPGILTASMGRTVLAELLAREKSQFLISSSAIAGLVNIAGNFVFIPYMGISGAALASSISYSLLSLLFTIGYLKETSVGWNMLVPRPNDFLPYRTFWRNRSVS